MGQAERLRRIVLRRRRYGRAAVRLALSTVVLVVVFVSIDGNAAREGVSRLRAGPWSLALGAFLLLHAASSQKWAFFLASCGAAIRRWHAMTCHAAGLFANLCLPSLIGGDVLRAGLAIPAIARRRRTAVVVGSLVDRMADVAALGTLVVGGVVWRGDAASRVVGRIIDPAILVLCVAALVVVGGAIALWMGRRWPLRRWPRKAARRMIEVLRAVRTLRRRPLRAAVGFSACVAIQSGFVLVNAGLGRAVGLDLDLGLWFLLWPLAKIAAMMPISLGGLGVREAAFAALVAPFGAESLAVVQSLVWQSILIAGGLAAGAFWAFGGRRQRS